jgi:hypothetical protein
VAEVAIVAGIEKPPITHTKSFPVESRIQQSLLSLFLVLFLYGYSCFPVNNNPFSLQRLSILGAFVYRHVECVHTETERVVHL